MAQDRLIRWGAKRPARADLGAALEDYLGGIAESVAWREDRWFAVLKGTTRDPFRRVEHPPVSRYPEELQNAERWIEVWIGDSSIDVITRMQDEITNRIADGFAALCARHWNGKEDEH